MTPFKVNKIVETYFAALINYKIEELQVKELKVKNNMIVIETEEGKIFKSGVKYE